MVYDHIKIKYNIKSLQYNKWDTFTKILKYIFLCMSQMVYYLIETFLTLSSYYLFKGKK